VTFKNKYFLGTYYTTTYRGSYCLSAIFAVAGKEELGAGEKFNTEL